MLASYAGRAVLTSIGAARVNVAALGRGRTMDRVTANLPAIDFEVTAAFYRALGFSVEFRDENWMILSRGDLEIEFFPYPDLDPWSSSASACIRVGDVDALYAAFATAGLPGFGIPRLTPPRDEPFGLRMCALVDPNGSLLRCLGPIPPAA